MKRIKPTPIDIIEPSPSPYVLLRPVGGPPELVGYRLLYQEYIHNKEVRDRAWYNTLTKTTTGESGGYTYKHRNFYQLRPPGIGDALYEGFTWRDTPEGFNYWDSVMCYYRGTRVSLPITSVPRPNITLAPLPLGKFLFSD